ncbi:28S ribosomal protein S18a [Tropilaelaps mercedesae]|uniref:28S ribosomal protein S18a n=1 Tax=Tropilaelaps mercedesae TaxID=418985 RepID=A0A1V9XYF3_9ACAR|nr:28S ribosomal protein S18a [Tropilaelaps mercedesae]
MTSSKWRGHGINSHNTVIVEHFLVNSKETEARQCSLCRMGIHNVRHTDVLVISQFMDRHGEILPRQITGLCAQQYRRVSISLYQAQRVGLIQNKRHTPKERWQELNNYFGKTRTKVDFGKPKINIWDFLKKPSEKKFWEA